MKPRIGILASHEGTTAQALIDACHKGALPVEIAVVISNNADAGVLRRAEKAGIRNKHLSRHTHPAPEELDAAIRDILHACHVDWVVLAGYMRPVGSLVLDSYKDHVINIHPGPLPDFGGAGMYDLHVHKAVLEAGLKKTEVTVHRVTAEYDQGPVIGQYTVDIPPGCDEPEKLKGYVQSAERKFYPQILAQLVRENSEEYGPPVRDKSQAARKFGVSV